MGERRVVDHCLESRVGGRFFDGVPPRLGRQVDDQGFDRYVVRGFNATLQVFEPFAPSRCDDQVSAFGRQSLGVGSADS